MIDLHLHTTASDGRSTPAELVDLAAQAGLRVMSVTDHDTVAAVADVKAFAAERGIEAISGIEVTAVLRGRDVRILGYFCDPADPAFRLFLPVAAAGARQSVECIVARLAELKMSVNFAISSRRHGAASGRRWPPHVHARWWPPDT